MVGPIRLVPAGDEVPLLLATMVDGAGWDVSPSGRSTSKITEMALREHAWWRPSVVTKLFLPRSTGLAGGIGVDISYRGGVDPDFMADVGLVVNGDAFYYS